MRTRFLCIHLLCGLLLTILTAWGGSIMAALRAPQPGNAVWHLHRVPHAFLLMDRHPNDVDLRLYKLRRGMTADVSLSAWRTLSDGLRFMPPPSIPLPPHLKGTLDPPPGIIDGTALEMARVSLVAGFPLRSFAGGIDVDYVGPQGPTPPLRYYVDWALPIPLSLPWDLGLDMPWFLPLKPIPLGLLGNTLLFGAACALLHRGARAFLHRVRNKRGSCRSCGYALTGLRGPACPECGGAT